MSETSVIQRPWLLAPRGGIPPGSTLGLNFMTGTLDPGITFTRASVGTYFDGSGVMQTASTNAPRFDYDPVTHLPNGLLLEEARTNLLLNSATLGTQSVAVTAQRYALTFYGTGNVTMSGAFSSSINGVGAFPLRGIALFTPTAGTLTLTVTGSVLNAQLEAGSMPTSYIPTAGATATRAADVATMPIGAWYNQATASGVFESVSPFAWTSGAANWAYSELTDAPGTTARILLYEHPNVAIVNKVASATVWNVNVSGVITPMVVTKAGWAGTPTTLTTAVNGQIPTTDAHGIAGVMTTVTIGAARNGWMRRIRFWPRTLSNFELQQVTR